MTRYIVTGGAGFIGSALVRTLLAAGGQVRVIDNLLSGREANLADVREQMEWDRSDIRDASAMLSAIRGGEIVFHLAAIPSVPRSIQDPVPSHEINIDGTFNVLRACVDAKVRRVVYAASSSAYGDTEVLPKEETMLPRPSPRTRSKSSWANITPACFIPALDWKPSRFDSSTFMVSGRIHRAPIPVCCRCS